MMFKWSKLMNPEKWPENPLGKPVMECETSEKARAIARAFNQVTPVDQLRELNRQHHQAAMDLYAAWYQRQCIHDEELH